MDRDPGIGSRHARRGRSHESACAVTASETRSFSVLSVPIQAEEAFDPTRS
jgi:hypothetical protein